MSESARRVGGESSAAGSVPAADPPTPDTRPPAPSQPRGGWLARWDVRARLRQVLHLDDEPWKIAGGLSVGVFIAFTPYYGVHTLMALAAAFLLRLNVAATVAGAWLMIPPLIPLAMAFCLRLGWVLVGRPKTPLAFKGVSAGALWANLAPHLWPLVVGTTAVGAAAAACTYLVAYQAIRRIRAARASRAAAAQVGETRPSDADFHLDKRQPPNYL